MNEQRKPRIDAEKSWISIRASRILAWFFEPGGEKYIKKQFLNKNGQITKLGRHPSNQHRMSITEPQKVSWPSKWIVVPRVQGQEPSAR